MTQECDYSRLLPIREAVFPTFDADQRAAAKAIAAGLAPKLEGCSVEAVIDLGCGTGEILALLRDQLASAGSGQITALGVDCCAAEIAIARNRYVGCEFIESRAEEFMSSIARSGIAHSAEHTVVMCVGHTIPHFRGTEALLDALAKWQPAFVLLDFHDGWDAVVEHFTGPDTEPLRQVKQQLKTPDGEVVTYTLTTKPDPAEPDRVLRGIEAFADGRPSLVPFWASQFLKCSGWYLTEMHRGGYVLARRIGYQSGYGRMNAFLMSRV
ncbi:MAG: hypothetical protein A49_15210 [Methyloceanibacter sp.]|nr:MAG: hypothetical protein A49_15210 [Methyloceanibacter sp.]